MKPAPTGPPPSILRPVADPRLELNQTAYEADAPAYLEHWRERRPLDAVRKFGGLVGRGARVLDVASGPALDVRLLRDVGLKVTAGDLSHAAAKVTRTMFPKGNVARWDFRRLPFRDSTFDGIWAAAALSQLPRGQVRATLREWRRVQRAGWIFASVPQGTGDLEPVEEPPAGTVHLTSATADELKALLLDAGYVEVEVEPRPDLGGRALTWLHGYGRLPS